MYRERQAVDKSDHQMRAGGNAHPLPGDRWDENLVVIDGMAIDLWTNWHNGVDSEPHNNRPCGIAVAEL